MSIGAFTERNHQPTQAEIEEMLGASVQTWQALVRHIRATFPGQENLKFCYGRQYGWSLTFRVRGSLLTALYPTRGAFVAQVILSRLALEQAQPLPLGDAARQAIARAKPYPEGKWLFIPIQSEQGLRDVQALLALKQRTLSRKKTAGNSG